VLVVVVVVGGGLGMVVVVVVVVIVVVGGLGMVVVVVVVVIVVVGGLGMVVVVVVNGEPESFPVPAEPRCGVTPLRGDFPVVTRVRPVPVSAFPFGELLKRAPPPTGASRSRPSHGLDEAEPSSGPLSATSPP